MNEEREVLSAESMELAPEAAADTAADHLWYVVHTYAGYENKVKANLEKNH